MHSFSQVLFYHEMISFYITPIAFNITLHPNGIVNVIYITPIVFNIILRANAIVINETDR